MSAPHDDRTKDGPSKVLVLDPDPRAGRQVQLGFEREGIAVVVSQDVGKFVLGPDAGIALVGGTNGQAIELVRRTRELLDAGHADVPIISTGRGASRTELEAAGADEVVTTPAYLRDLVTIARIMRGTPARPRAHFVGSLVETTGVYTLVRALSALGRSAVLTLIRGLRRGEVRFHRGEVTSAQVGLIHGQAAFHQLLLWTDARFDFSPEDVVRRQQIPLTPDELFADAERFLVGVRESAERLSPSMVLEQDTLRVQTLGKQIPHEVHSVLRMFDGHRVLADVLEDSPYRVFETLRVAQKALEAGLLQPVESQRPKATWRAVLSIEEWLVGSETRDAVVERTAKLDSGPFSPISPISTKKASRKKRKKRRSTAPPSAASKADIDWGALVPRVIGAEVGPLAGVVPAMDTHGEIDVASRGTAREGLEALMDTDKRERIFPREVGIEPSVVVRGEDTDEWERSERDAKAKHDAEATAKADADAKLEADAKAKLEADAKAKADAERDAQKFRDEAQAKVREQVERLRLDRILKENALLESERAAAQMIAVPTAPITITETATAVVTVADTLTVVTVADTVTVTATPVVTIREPVLGVPVAGAPIATEDEPSDGIVRAISPGDSARLAAQAAARRPPPPAAVEGPILKDTTGEIQPSAQRTNDPIEQEPSVLVSDLAAAHTAVAAALAAPRAKTQPPGDAASAVRELAVAEVRRDAVAFTEQEEAFFKTDPAQPNTASVPRIESFDDLDEGYQPPKFWDRVFGRKTHRDSQPVITPPPKKR